MLKIRLKRVGKKKQAYFRIVVMEHARKPKGKYLEFFGSWNPHKDKINVDAERVKYWLSKGAQPSDTVHNLLVGVGILKQPKKVTWKPKKKKKGEPVASSSESPSSEIPSSSTLEEDTKKPEEGKDKEQEQENEKKEEKVNDGPVESEEKPTSDNT